eukprot:14402102-Ditylum_brightwellii.AAC.1
MEPCFLRQRWVSWITGGLFWGSEGKDTLVALGVGFPVLTVFILGLHAMVDKWDIIEKPGLHDTD